MLFRSLRSLAGRGLAAGAAALALTLFNAAQPSLSSDHKIHPGTVKDVPIGLAPAAAPGAVAVKAASFGGAPQVKAAAQAKSGTAKTKATETTTGARLLSAPVAVGKARFVGFSWPDSGAPAREGTVWLRARTAAGWSGWREVEEADGGPDATSSEYRAGRAYSDGQWLEAGTAEVQVRVDPPAKTAKAAEAATPPAPAEQGSGLEAHLITPDLTPTPGTEAPQAGVATAATRQPAIVSRARWGADERIRRAKPSYSDTVKAAFVHHTVQSNRYSPSESAAFVRSDYLYHVKTRGWNDVGYNFLVDRYGRVFEGRYGGITRAVLGAHAGGFNTNSTGVALLGDFSSARPPARMLAAMERLLAWKLDLTHVDPRGRTTLRSAGGANVRYPKGRKVVVNTITGHRTTSYTACPGNPTIALLPRIRAAVNRIGRPKIYGGSASTARVRPERGGSAEVRARFSSTVRWRLTVTGSNGATARSFSGRGASARVRWNGRASARPASSRVFVLRSAPAAGSSTGGFANGAWRVSNVNAEQRSTKAGVFATYRWGRKGDLPVVGDWDGNGTWTPGVLRSGARWYLKDSLGGGAATVGLRKQTPGAPVVGDWDGRP